MSGTPKGAALRRARQIGITVEELHRRVSSGQKWCTGCKSFHPVDEFGRDASRADGLNAKCRTAATGPRRRPGPGMRERRQKRAAGLAWCRGCAAWLAAAAVSRQGACQPCLNAEYRRRYQVNPNIKATVMARSRKLATTPPWWREREMTGAVCAYGCNRPATVLDHIWPVARGGRSMPGNLAPACDPCNSKKKAALPFRWVERGFVALPEFWTERAALAVETGCDEWIEEAA